MASPSSPRPPRITPPMPRRRWRATRWKSCSTSVIAASLSAVTTAARGSPTGWRSISPTGSKDWPCSTSCQPSNTLNAADMAFAMGYYHWFWFAQPHPFPETLINAAPEAWFRAHTTREPKPSTFFHPEALADYLAAARRPEMIQGMCEDYRAAASIDLEHDRASRAAGSKV